MLPAGPEVTAGEDLLSDVRVRAVGTTLVLSLDSGWPFGRRLWMNARSAPRCWENRSATLMRPASGDTTTRSSGALSRSHSAWNRARRRPNDTSTALPPSMIRALFASIAPSSRPLL